MKSFSLWALALLAGAAPAFAAVTVNSPSPGATVGTSFVVTATASPCSSQPVASMGYSLDNSSNTTIVNAASLSASVSASPGNHVLHVKSWGNQGASCTADVNITVANTSNQPPFGFLDQAVAQSGNLRINGWAADTQDGAPVGRYVQILIDGNVAGNATLGSARPDVAKAYNNSAYLNSGWTFAMAASRLSTGSHTITAVAYDSLNVSTTLKGTKTITVAANTSYPPFGRLEQAVAQSGNLQVAGWAADAQDGAPVGNYVQILIDGNVVGNATLGRVRPDVQAAYNNPAYLNSGWTFSMAASRLSTGSHTVTAVAYDSLNVSTTLGSKTITVAAPPGEAPAPTPTGPSIPATANVLKAIHKLSTWKAEYDVATGNNGASATGATSLVPTPSMSGLARQFSTTYSNYGGERYHVSLAPDKDSTNFVYDTQIYIASPSNSIANIEMDLNQVTANGQTVIMGFQCDAWSGTWDYTTNAGTPTNPVDQWLHSNQTCNPQKWSTNTWHRVQIQYSRDNSGNVTYHSVWLDGVQQDLNVTVPSSFALGWAPTVLTNFQLDGMTAGTSNSTVYLDNTTIYSW